MIRTSKHKFTKPNKNKYEKLNLFINQYKQATQYFVDYIWNNLIDQNLNSPNMISTKGHVIGDLSQRAIKCSATQACGIIKGVLDLKRRRIYVLSQLDMNSKEYNKLKELIDNQKISKPNINGNCELNSICFDIKDNHIQLKSIGKFFGKIRLPFKFHKGSKKWSKKGKMLNSILLNEKGIDLRWEIENKLKSEGNIVGLDQGKITLISLSDGQTTKPNKHNHDLNTILERLSRKKKGSKGFKREQDHRKNYINWSINQLNLKNIKQINFEDIKNVRKGKTNSRIMSHWTYALIKSKVERLCEELGVQVKYNSSPYRSQRCNRCGLVLKSNRNKKVFCCKGCGYVEDSDINASKNHEQDLPFISFKSNVLNNLEGFYWRLDGLFDINGKEITVPYANKT